MWVGILMKGLQPDMYKCKWSNNENIQPNWWTGGATNWIINGNTSNTMKPSREEVVHIYRYKQTSTVRLSRYEQWGRGIEDKYKVEARISISDS